MITISSTLAWYFEGGPTAPHLVATPDELHNPELLDFFRLLGGFPEPYDDCGEEKFDVCRWVIPTADENAGLVVSEYGGRWNWTLISRTTHVLPQGSGRKLTVWLDLSSQSYQLRVTGKGAGATFQLRKEYEPSDAALGKKQ